MFQKTGRCEMLLLQIDNIYYNGNRVSFKHQPNPNPYTRIRYFYIKLDICRMDRACKLISTSVIIIVYTYNFFFFLS